MKKVIFFVFFAGFVFSATAQKSFFTIGPKIGFNTTTLSYNIDTIKSQFKGNAQYGIFMRIGKRFYVQPEAVYRVEGGKSETTTDASQQDITLKSVSVPVLLGFKVFGSGPVNFRVMAGPVFSYTLDTKLDFSNPNEVWPINSTDDLKKAAWSLQAGAGVDVYFATLDVRYEYGMSNIYAGEKASVNTKNHLINVSLGFKLF